MRDEYDFSKLGKPVRGRCFSRYQRGVLYVPIEADLVSDFPNAEAVNEGLRELRKLKRESA